MFEHPLPAMGLDDGKEHLGSELVLEDVVLGATPHGFAHLGDLGKRGIRLALLAVPAGAAQEIAERLVEAGVRGILNLAPCYLKLPKRIKVVTIDIAMELGILPYYV